MNRSRVAGAWGACAVVAIGCSSGEPPREETETTSAAVTRGAAPADAAKAKPNVLIWMLDDVGFGHLSPFGGPVRTPNIERVASRGLRYTNFHTTALCSPSRGALLTGRNHHSIGMGKITELASDEPGYTGRIPPKDGTFVEALRESGYRTLALGKWHNTPIEDVTVHGPYDLWPMGLGFEHFYGFQGGDTNNWAPGLWSDTKPVEPYVGNPDYHLTTDLADHAIAFLDERAAASTREPFLLYFATGTAHAPHHAPKAWIAKNKGRFDQGWDAVRDETFARQKRMGIMPPDARLPPRPDAIPAWDSLSPDEQRLFAHMQEVYSAAIEHADDQFGRILDELQKIGELDRTIVIVTSDNGASGEGALVGSYNEARLFNGVPEDLATNLKLMDKLGGPETYNHYPAGWALAGNTPGRYWKQTTHEGGVRDPMVISWPAGVAAHGEVRSQFTHMVDVAPTILELTGVASPAVIDGVPQAPLEGTSFVPTLADGSAPTQRTVQYFEMFANRGVWAGGWKAVTFHGRYPWDVTSHNPNYDKDVWELFNLDADPSESNDLSALYPEKLDEMKALFDLEARAHNVYPLDDSTTALLAANYRRLLGGRTSFTFQGVTVRTPEPLSPPIKNHAHTITAHVSAAKAGMNGLLATCGGRFGGYALYVQGGRLVYAYNYLGETTYTVQSKGQVPAGDVELKMVFVKTGLNQGHATLYIDGALVAEGDVPRTVPNVFSLDETFDTGMDTGTPAGDYQVPFEYTGTLRDVTVSIDDVAPSTTEVLPNDLQPVADD
jgi:arylsulfatase